MRNLTMLTDLYQLTMMYGYQKCGMRNNRAVFDMFYRNTGDVTQYAIMAGLEQLIDYIKNLRFDEDALSYLTSLNLFDAQFIAALRDFRFTGDIYAVPEGTIVFPGEPLIRVSAPIFEAQLIETALLNIINHQTLIATKASRVVQAAQGGIPIKGTHAHSWVMSFPTELDAFRAYAKFFPTSCLLLVDTYDTLKSGMPNAITVFRELRAQGYEPAGIRLDSGDLAYLSREARRMLDEAGFPEAKICASGDLDEMLIRDLKLQGACIDIWGVGTKLITSADCPALGGVYKLSAELVDGHYVPKIKISENPAKITNPGVKMLYRVYDGDGMAVADLIALDHERFDPAQPLTLFDPVDTWKTMTLANYTMKKLLVPVFVAGEQVYQSPSLLEIQAHCREDLATFWDQYKRLLNPHRYKVDLSDELWMLKQSMLKHGVETVQAQK